MDPVSPEISAAAVNCFYELTVSMEKSLYIAGIKPDANQRKAIVKAADDVVLAAYGVRIKDLF